MVDRYLALLDGVETKMLNRAVKKKPQAISRQISCFNSQRMRPMF